MKLEAGGRFGNMDFHVPADHFASSDVNTSRFLRVDINWLDLIPPGCRSSSVEGFTFGFCS